MQRLMQNTLIAINFLIVIKKLITNNPRCNLDIPRKAVTQQHTHKNSDVTACRVLLFVKREVHHCDFYSF